MKTGSSSPTARIARTGELTPPGMSSSARRQRSDRVLRAKRARSFVQYETTMSAPARLIAVSDSERGLPLVEPALRAPRP